MIPPDQGPEALGEGNLLALASRITVPHPYYLGYATAAAHYGLTTQHRNIIYLVTLARLRDRRLHGADVRIVNPVPRKFIGFGPVDVLGYTVMMTDVEKTAIDCVDRPDLAGGVGEGAAILAAASRRCDWGKTADYLARIGSKALTRRYGWLVDHTGAEMPADVREHLLRQTSGGRKTYLGSPRPVTGSFGYDPIWRLDINVSAEELYASRGSARRRTVRKDA